MGDRDASLTPAPPAAAPAMSATAKAAVVDWRVRRLRRAIRAGRYRIDTNRIAGKLIKAGA